MRFHAHLSFAKAVSEFGFQFMIEATEQDLLPVSLAPVNRNDESALGYEP
jgi:hypothetical protein